jgi:hypothetical protein
MDLHAAILARGSRGDCVGVDKFGSGPRYVQDSCKLKTVMNGGTD